VLVVEDKESLRLMLKLALEQQQYSVHEARDAAAASAAFEAADIDLVLTDLRLPEGDGFGVLEAAKRHDPDLPVVVMTAYGGFEDAVRAMREGALDFLAKPIDPAHLALVVSRALAQRRVAAENILMRDELAQQRGAPPLVGEHESLRRVLGALQKAAASDATVLLEGESGTGKELFARRLHALSARNHGPFVAINCAAIPESLLETELFGHERGAFTGASSRKLGRFEVANHGTLFLDEIGDMPPALQPKLLRSLESREIDRVGGGAPVPIDVRVVAATNRGLRAAVAARKFREDLFFRLSVFPITIPPLRDRRSDIAILAQHFVEQCCREQGKSVLPMAPAAVAALEQHAWPGNVRELQNCIERAVVLNDSGIIQPHHLNLAVAADVTASEPPAVDPWQHIDLSGSLSEATARVVAELERRKIALAMEDAGGDAGRAADELRVPYRALLAKLREHKLAS
jgi:DNA-binding NtrC family response regulator